MSCCAKTHGTSTRTTSDARYARLLLIAPRNEKSQQLQVLNLDIYFLLLTLHHLQFAGHRGEIHELISNYAVSIGVKFQLGEKVVDYVDEGTEGLDRKVGALCESGAKYMGDVVLCCDGPKSLARVKVLGLEDNKVNSGYAIYRAFYDLTPEMRNNIHMSRFCGES